jgi:predicted AAA+ superfamily ATPase
MVRILPPWHENIAKRQVKRPKVYLRDSGLLHSLLGLDDEASLLTHPKLGASWEGFALEQFLLINGVENRDAYFWAVHQQAELDLLIHRGGKRYGVEIKYVDAPRVTSSMRQAIDLLKLEKLFVLIPNGVRAPVADRIELLPLSASLPPVL